MKRLPLYLLAALALAGLGYGAYVFGLSLAPQPALGGTELQNKVDVSEVQLVNAAGEKVALSSFAGRHLLVFFGYTRCPDVCPLTLGRLAKLYEDLGEPKNLQVAMVTVDPAYDTPEVVQRYASSFHPDFIGLSGSNTEVAQAAKTFYIGFQAANELIAHTDAVILVDPRSRMSVVYTQPSLPELQADLERLL